MSMTIDLTGFTKAAKVTGYHSDYSLRVTNRYLVIYSSIKDRLAFNPKSANIFTHADKKLLALEFFPDTSGTFKVPVTRYISTRYFAMPENSEFIGAYGLTYQKNKEGNIFIYSLADKVEEKKK